MQIFISLSRIVKIPEENFEDNIFLVNVSETK